MMYPKPRLKTTHFWRSVEKVTFMEEKMEFFKGKLNEMEKILNNE